MALVYTRVKSWPDKYQQIYDITVDASYPAGGYVLTPGQMGAVNIYHLDGSFVTGEGFAVTFIASTNKLKIYKSAAGATPFTEVANTDLTTAMKIRVNVTCDPIL